VRDIVKLLIWRALHDFDCCSCDVCLSAVLTPQVTYFPLPVSNAQEQQAVNIMKGLVAQCLQVDPSSRPAACDIQSDLFDPTTCACASGTFLSFPFLSFPFLSFPFLSFPFLSFPFFSFPFSLSCIWTRYFRKHHSAVWLATR